MSEIELALQGLSEEERIAALKILEEVQSTGTSDSLYDLYKQDYDEIPVDIYTFLHNERYLGKGLIDDEGRYTVFPYWEQLLNRLYPDPMKPATCNTLALTGAIGLGKSFEAVLVGLYELYRMLCLKDPYVYYGLQPIDRITFVIANITLDAAKSVAWDKMQQLLQVSPWFMEHGTVSGTTNIVWQPTKNIELIAASLPRHYIGRAVFWAFFDEVSFQPNSDVEKQKERAKLLISTATARMQSRFMRNDVNPTILVLASSKRTEQSFMETFIEGKKKNESKTTIVIDEPQWVIRTDKDSDVKFKVAVGNKFLSSEIVPLTANEEELELYRRRGYTLLDVPIGFYETFVDDINVALTDIAGISTTSSSRYFAGPRIAAVKRDTIENLFTRDVIEVGNSSDDKIEYKDFIDLTRLNPKLKEKPLYIHLDMSISGDKTGIAGVWITGKKPTTDGSPSKDLFYQLAFVVSVKAPKGYQVSFEKNRNFIRWLRQQGFRVKGVSSDTFQSYDLQQQLKAEHFDCEIISVDRTKDGVCLPYQALRSAIYEERLLLPEKCTLLTDELLGLEKDSNGKIDHSPAGVDSKDSADGVCGALFNASQHAEEYAYEYGEDMNLIFNTNENTSAFDYTRDFMDGLLSIPTNPYQENILTMQEPPLKDALAETLAEMQEEKDKKIDDEQERKRKEFEARVAEAKRLQQGGASVPVNSQQPRNTYFNPNDGILSF